MFQVSCVKVGVFASAGMISFYRDDYCLGGDFVKGDGTGSFSIYGDKFPVSC